MTVVELPSRPEPKKETESPRMLAIRALLERLEDFTDPMRGGEGDGQTGLLRMPATYWGSVREVERLVVVLREERHHLWWHLNERYLRATTRTLFHCPKCGGDTHSAVHKHRDKRGRLSSYKGRRFVETSYRVEKVDQVKVRKAVAWMADQWGQRYEPESPDAILARLDKEQLKRKERAA